MIHGNKVCVVCPAYNAAKTIRKTCEQIDRAVVDEIIVVDDYSTDETRRITQDLGVSYAFHSQNLGYGGNQKTCYSLALATGADIVIMLHPDYQYEPLLVPAMAHMLASRVYDVVIASRILGKGALKGGMPLYKYISNRILTLIQNWMIGQKLSEYHTGYRAFTRQVLEQLPLMANSDDFIFDNQMLIQCHCWGFRIAEISCPTKYFPEASSINFVRSLKYGLGTLAVSTAALLYRLGIWRPEFLEKNVASSKRLSIASVVDRIEYSNLPIPSAE